MKRAIAFSSGLMLATVLLVSASARQQSGDRKAPTSSAQEMQPAKPDPEMERLKFLQGKWRYSENYPKSWMMPAGGTGKGTYVATPGPGGFSQFADFQGTSPEGDIVGHEVIAWDPAEGVYKSYVFGNNFPGCFMKKGHWEGDNLVFTGDFSFQGMTVHFHDATTANADGSVTIVEQSSLGDAPLELALTTTAVRE
jgi:Protein of unknown function (DUF1579)